MTILGKLIDGNLRTELSFDIEWFRDSIFANLGDKLLSLVPPFYELLSLLLSVVSLSQRLCLLVTLMTIFYQSYYGGSCS